MVQISLQLDEASSGNFGPQLGGTLIGARAEEQGMARKDGRTRTE